MVDVGVGEEDQLDIRDRVFDVGGLGDERGLLALAFHPEFPANGLIYVHYNDVSGDTVIRVHRGLTDDRHPRA